LQQRINALIPPDSTIDTLRYIRHGRYGKNSKLINLLYASILVFGTAFMHFPNTMSTYKTYDRHSPVRYFFFSPKRHCSQVYYFLFGPQPTRFLTARAVGFAVVRF